MMKDKLSYYRHWITKISGVEPDEIKEENGLISFSLKTKNSALNVFENHSEDDVGYCLIRTEIVEDEQANYAETLIFRASTSSDFPGYAIEGLYERPVSSKEIATFEGTVIFFEDEKDNDPSFKIINEAHNMRTVSEFLVNLKYDVLALANSIPQMGNSDRSKNLKQEFYHLIAECMRKSSFQKDD